MECGAFQSGTMALGSTPNTVIEFLSFSNASTPGRLIPGQALGWQFANES